MYRDSLLKLILVAVTILVIFGISLDFLSIIRWTSILLLYSFQIRRNKIRSSSIPCHLRLFLILIIKLKLTLGLLSSSNHTRWY